MSRSLSSKLVVKSPDKGLLTALPPDLSVEEYQRYLVRASNVRAQYGQLSAAPGYERVHITDEVLDSAANLIFQPSIMGVDAELRTTPIVGTDGKLFVMRRRSRNLVCGIDKCRVTFAVVGETGELSESGGSIPTEDVAKLVRGWSPDFVVHTGNCVSPTAGFTDDGHTYDEIIGRFYSDFLDSGRFFPSLGKDDWVTGPVSRYLDFFNLPPPERYYSIRRGPVEIFVLSTYGVDTDAVSGGETSLVWPSCEQAQWLSVAVSASSAAWRIVVCPHPDDTSEESGYNAFPVLDWPWESLGIDLVLHGRSRVYERLLKNGVPRFVVGLGGAPIDTFVDGEVNPFPAESQFRYNDDFGALRIEADRQTLTASFYDRSGTLIDSVTRVAQRSSTVCYVGDRAKTAVSLKVIPSTATTEVGLEFPLYAEATFSDGTKSIVTGESGWSSDNTEVLTVDRGVVRGQKLGQATVTAEYSGLSATSVVDVVVSCVDKPVDVVAVLDRSYSMAVRSKGTTRMARLQQAANLMIDAMALSPGVEDRVGIVGFGGSYENQTPDSQLLAPLGSTVTELRAAVASLVPGGATAVSEAFDKGVAELTGDNHRDGNRQVLILFTDGFANVLEGTDTNPVPGSVFTTAMDAVTASATAAKAAGITVMVIALDVGWDAARKAVVESWASEGLFYSVDAADELLPAFANALGDLCRQGSEGSGEGDQNVLARWAIGRIATTVGMTTTYSNTLLVGQSINVPTDGSDYFVWGGEGAPVSNLHQQFHTLADEDWPNIDTTELVITITVDRLYYWYDGQHNAEDAVEITDPNVKAGIQEKMSISIGEENYGFSFIDTCIHYNGAEDSTLWPYPGGYLQEDPVTKIQVNYLITLSWRDRNLGLAGSPPGGGGVYY